MSAPGWDWVGDRVGRYVNRFVFDLAIPVLLFRTMVRMSVPDVSPWTLWASYFGGIAVSWMVASGLVFSVLGRTAREACVTGFGSGYSNTVLLGLPLVFSFFPDGQGAVPLFIILSIHLPVMMVTGTALFEWSEQVGPCPRRRSARADRESDDRQSDHHRPAWRAWPTGRPASA